MEGRMGESEANPGKQILKKKHILHSTTTKQISTWLTIFI